MTVNKRTLQRLAVALYIANQAQDLGKQWQTSNEKLAMEVSEILATMCTFEEPKQVKTHIDTMIEVANDHGFPDIESWTYVALVINWLSWAWHEQGEDELSKAWAKAWYRINDYSLKTLKGPELAYYAKETD